MRIGYIKDENGNLVRKWVKNGEEGKDPDVLYQVAAQFGDYIWTDDEHMDEAKNTLLEQMINTIRSLAKVDEFWIVKREDDYRNENPLVDALGNPLEYLVPQEAKDGKCTVAWLVEFPQFSGYYPWKEAQEFEKKLQECCVQDK